jgi:hypothetical protein
MWIWIHLCIFNSTFGRYLEASDDDVLRLAAPTPPTTRRRTGTALDSCHLCRAVREKRGC